MAYSQFHDGFWTDPEIRQLSSDDKMLLIWFITNPARHYSGIYFFELESISKQTGLPEKTVIRGIDTLSAIGFLKYNSKFSMVWVKKMARHEVVKSEKTGIYSDKQTKGIANQFDKLHKCPLIKDFLDYYSDMDIPYRYGIRQEEVEVEVKEKTETEVPPHPPKKSGKKTKAEKAPWPENFCISDRVRKWAEENKVNHLEEHFEAFRLLSEARGYTYVNWDSAFINCIKGDWGKVNQTHPETRQGPNMEAYIKSKANL